VPELSALYVDFQCPYSYRVWRWLSAIGVREEVEVRPFSLDTTDDEPSPWDRTKPSTGLELLALGELARETGQDTHLAFVDAAFAGMHAYEADLSSLEAWLELGSNVGLDLDAFTADAERWRAEVGLWHQEAADELGVFGTPSLLFGDETALFVRLGADVADAEAGTRLLSDLADLSLQPLSEVKRTN
jgi:2-hydroxychromene-2-carboxylate isomerase